MEIAFQRVVLGGLRFFRQTVRKSTNLPSTPRFIPQQSPGSLVRFATTDFRRLLFSRNSPVLNTRRVKSVWESISFRLRKQAVQRLISGLNGRPHNSRYITLLSFGFVGFVLSEDGAVKQNPHTPNDSEIEVLFATYRNANNCKQDHELRCAQDEVCLPNRLNGYDVQNSLIGKGCFGATYPARLRDIEIGGGCGLPENKRTSCVGDRSSGSEVQDGASSATDRHDENEDGWELVSQEKMRTNSDNDIALPNMAASNDNESSDWSVTSIMNNGGDSRGQRRVEDHSSNPLEVDLQDTKNGTFNLQGGFNLAIKIFGGGTPNEEIFETEKIVLDEKHREEDDRRRTPLHPNIIVIHRAFTEENVSAERFKEARDLFPSALPLPQLQNGNNRLMFLVMKRYDMTLRDYMKKFGCRGEDMAKMMLCQLLEGASHLASVGIAHRDLKSDNILLGGVGRDDDVPLLVITDFGCCLDGGEGGLRVPLNSQSRLAGNATLRAPEIEAAFSDYRASYLDYRKSDGWAIGTIAFEICGMPNPFYSKGVSNIGYKEENLPVLPSFVSPEFQFVIMGLLRKDPEDRLECKEAADMLHLLLWIPECWSKGPVNLSMIPYLKRILYGWLRDDACHEGHEGHEGSSVTRQLQSTFLSRVKVQDLMTTGKKLVLVRWEARLQEMYATVVP